MAAHWRNGFQRMAKRKELEMRMRSLEWFHRERVLPGLWLIVRLDGRAFGRFTATRFEKPFDPRVLDLMCGAARALLIDFNGLYTYTMSDEISLLLPRRWDLCSIYSSLRRTGPFR